MPAAFEIQPVRVESFLNAAASYLGADPLTAVHPQIQAELPLPVFRGARLQGFIPPVTPAPLAHGHREALACAVTDHENILVVGGTGSGKTTFANALLHEIATLCPQERIVLLEDTAELQCRAADTLSLRTRAGLGLADLVRATLRTSPDRIVVGEVRDAAALAVLDAWATGQERRRGTLAS